MCSFVRKPSFSPIHIQVLDTLGEFGLVYTVEFSGRDLINVAKKRTNIVPIMEDIRHPHKCCMLMVSDDG